MAQNPLKVGDKVYLRIPEDTESLDMQKYDKGEYVIAKITHARGGYCELEGVLSGMGIPYSFTLDCVTRV